MRLLLTNDDGYDALGLGLLAELCEARGDVSIVAPQQEQSGVGHRVHTRGALALDERAPERYALDGTPADCTRVALKALHISPDWVLSGLNHGGNLGVDLVMSGTVAGAREGAIHGHQAIALSLVLHRDHRPDPVQVRGMLENVLDTLMARPLPTGRFYNVNLPFNPESDTPELVFCEPDPSAHDVRYRQEEDGYHYEGLFLNRGRKPGLDVDVVWTGKVAVSELSTV